jgi:lipopolysaccharide export system permease protein
MKKLDKFILTSFIGPFIAILFVVMFILVMQFLWLYIDELVGKGLGLKVILEFLFWGNATLIPLSLPLATLLASMMTLGNLSENNELLAIKAAGISLKRVLTPLAIVCFIVSIAAFFASNNLIPVAFNKIFTLRDDISRTKEEIKIPTGTFYDGIDGYILRVNERNDETGMLHGVMVYNHTGTKGNTSLTIADSAKMSMSESKTYLTFALFSGTNYEETNDRKYRDTTLQLQRISFDKQTLIIPLENYSFQKSDSSRFGDEVKSKKLKELVHDKDSLTHLNDSTKLVNLKVLRQSRILKHNDQLDTTAKTYVNGNFPIDILNKWENIDAEITACEYASTAVGEYSSTITSFNRETYMYNYLLRRIDVGILIKFSLSLACFIFFFIGAPIGALIRKGGLGTPAIISVLFFVLYWVIDISGQKLARDGAVSAHLGVFISTYVLFPIGVFLTWQAINDSSIFSADKIKHMARKIKTKVMGYFKKTRIVYMGTPEFAVASLDALIKEGYDVVGVVTVADKASGRGLKVNESAVKKYAVEHKLRILQPISLKDPEFLSELQSWKPDLFVVVAFRMLPKVVWEMPKLGTFNLHAALLPQYRGAAPINWAVINGDNVSGVTSFMIDEGMDTGNIMMREQVKIESTDTAGDLHDKLMEIGAEVVVQTVEKIIEKHVEFRPQKTFIQGSEVLKPAPKLTRELCHIDWDAKTKEIYNLIRGLSPYPAAFTELVKDGKATQMKIYKATKVDEKEYQTLVDLHGTDGKLEAGMIVSDNKSYFWVTTLDGLISVDELQLAGKKRMPVKDFLIGFRDPMSYKLSKGSSHEIIANAK